MGTAWVRVRSRGERRGPYGHIRDGVGWEVVEQSLDDVPAAVEDPVPELCHGWRLERKARLDSKRLCGPAGMHKPNCSKQVSCVVHRLATEFQGGKGDSRVADILEGLEGEPDEFALVDVAALPERLEDLPGLVVHRIR